MLSSFWVCNPKGGAVFNDSLQPFKKQKNYLFSGFLLHLTSVLIFFTFFLKVEKQIENLRNPALPC
jgi:hypothetical protein